MMDAHRTFAGALADYTADNSPALWRRLRTALRALQEAVVHRIDFTIEGRRIETQQDERILMEWFLDERGAPFIALWIELLDEVEDGAELSIRPGDAPRWTDDR